MVQEPSSVQERRLGGKMHTVCYNAQYFSGVSNGRESVPAATSRSPDIFSFASKSLHRAVTDVTDDPSFVIGGKRCTVAACEEASSISEPKKTDVKGPQALLPTSSLCPKRSSHRPDIAWSRSAKHAVHQLANLSGLFKSKEAHMGNLKVLHQLLLMKRRHMHHMKIVRRASAGRWLASKPWTIQQLLMEIPSGAAGFNQDDLVLLLVSMSSLLKREKRYQESTSNDQNLFSFSQTWDSSGDTTLLDHSLTWAPATQQACNTGSGASFSLNHKLSIITDADWWWSVLAPPLLSMSLRNHAVILEQCANLRAHVPGVVAQVWGSVLERMLGNTPLSSFTNSIISPLLLDSNWTFLVRLLVAFSRVGRRPKHSVMNAILVHIQPELPSMPAPQLAACLSALTRLQYIPTGPAQDWSTTCLSACADKVHDFDVDSAKRVLNALAMMEANPWARYRHRGQVQRLLNLAASYPPWHKALVDCMPGSLRSTGRAGTLRSRERLLRGMGGMMLRRSRVSMQRHQVVKQASSRETRIQGDSTSRYTGSHKTRGRMTSYFRTGVQQLAYRWQPRIIDTNTKPQHAVQDDAKEAQGSWLVQASSSSITPSAGSLPVQNERSHPHPQITLGMNPPVKGFSPRQVSFALWALVHFPRMRLPGRYVDCLLYWASEHAWMLSAATLTHAMQAMAQYKRQVPPHVLALLWQAIEELWDKRFDIPSQAAVLWMCVKSRHTRPTPGLMSSALTSMATAVQFRFLNQPSVARGEQGSSTPYHQFSSVAACSGDDGHGDSCQGCNASSSAIDCHQDAEPSRNPLLPPSWKLVVKPTDLARLLWASAQLIDSPECTAGSAAEKVSILAAAAAATLHRMRCQEAVASLWALAIWDAKSVKFTSMDATRITAVTREALARALTSQLLSTFHHPAKQAVNMTHGAGPGSYKGFKSQQNEKRHQQQEDVVTTQQHQGQWSLQMMTVPELTRLAWAVTTLELPLPSHMWHKVLERVVLETQVGPSRSADQGDDLAYTDHSSGLSSQPASSDARAEARRCEGQDALIPGRGSQKCCSTSSSSAVGNPVPHGRKQLVTSEAAKWLCIMARLSSSLKGGRLSSSLKGGRGCKAPPPPSLNLKGGNSCHENASPAKEGSACELGPGWVAPSGVMSASDHAAMMSAADHAAMKIKSTAHLPNGIAHHFPAYWENLVSSLLSCLQAQPPKQLDVRTLVEVLSALSKLKRTPQPSWLLAACIHLSQALQQSIIMPRCPPPSSTLQPPSSNVSKLQSPLISTSHLVRLCQSLTFFAQNKALVMTDLGRTPGMEMGSSSVVAEYGGEGYHRHHAASADDAVSSKQAGITSNSLDAYAPGHYNVDKSSDAICSKKQCPVTPVTENYKSTETVSSDSGSAIMMPPSSKGNAHSSPSEANNNSPPVRSGAECLSSLSIVKGKLALQRPVWRPQSDLPPQLDSLAAFTASATTLLHLGAAGTMPADSATTLLHLGAAGTMPADSATTLLHLGAAGTMPVEGQVVSFNESSWQQYHNSNLLMTTSASGNLVPPSPLHIPSTLSGHRIMTYHVPSSFAHNQDDDPDHAGKSSQGTLILQGLLKQAIACQLNSHVHWDDDHQVNQLTAQQATILLWSCSMAHITTLHPDHLAALSGIVERAYVHKELDAGCLARSILAVSELLCPKASTATLCRSNALGMTTTDDYSAGKEDVPATQVPLLLVVTKHLASLKAPVLEEPLIAFMTADEVTMMLLGLVQLVGAAASDASTSAPSAHWVNAMLQQVKTRSREHTISTHGLERLLKVLLILGHHPGTSIINWVHRKLQRMWSAASSATSSSPAAAVVADSSSAGRGGMDSTAVGLSPALQKGNIVQPDLAFEGRSNEYRRLSRMLYQVQGLRLHKQQLQDQRHDLQGSSTLLSDAARQVSLNTTLTLESRRDVSMASVEEPVSQQQSQLPSRSPPPSLLQPPSLLLSIDPILAASSPYINGSKQMHHSNNVVSAAHLITRLKGVASRSAQKLVHSNGIGSQIGGPTSRLPVLEASSLSAIHIAAEGSLSSGLAPVHKMLLQRRLAIIKLFHSRSNGGGRNSSSSTIGDKTLIKARSTTRRSLPASLPVRPYHNQRLSSGKTSMPTNRGGHDDSNHAVIHSLGSTEQAVGIKAADDQGNTTVMAPASATSTSMNKGAVAQVLCIRLLSMKFDKVLEFALSVYAMRSAYHFHVKGTLATAARKPARTKVVARSK
ncbi:hypothetical protein CEUSTIGMA_g3797.t1 [Chlamydomonas eustigma]|uniref:Uncharacterized protein n=1 Tax=Chlamydomonas eustigma TaxID=1157962 RepID=A0A250WZU4_9CHLO|nr:hypothetical protein CEUSTIGMA_g3797.t1 [Chlamydomonas eustigma]|eukprot:GAX76351.1 hypothetical protein CEUSTIGMA_g3797.t1 [Chlamydomonas eustigma]